MPSANPLRKDDRIYVAGHTGLVGSALLSALGQRGHSNLVTASRASVDLTNQSATRAFVADAKPSVIFMCAGRVGGIRANDTYRAEFIRDNLLISTNLLDAAHHADVKKMVVLASSCIYPRLAQQPLKEEYLLGGPLEPTNEPYAIAKIASIVLARSYRDQFGMNAISVVPANVYGPRDNFDPEEGHVIPALIRRFHAAKFADLESVKIWGTGAPVREFLYVDDLADALIFLADNYDGREPINIGCGSGITVLSLATAIAKTVGFRGRIVPDPARPDGVPMKRLDASRIEAMGWRVRTPLTEGLQKTYAWFLDNPGDVKWLEARSVAK